MKSVILLTLLIFGTTLNGQNTFSIKESEKYLSIIKSGQTWVGQKGQAGPPESFQHKYAEDSILQNSKYYFQRIQSDNQDGSLPYVEGIYRESMGKLYRKIGEENPYEEVVVDMSLGLGDVIKDTFDSLMVVMVDTVLYSDNIPRKRIKLECLESIDDPVFWVEGIGRLTDGTFCAIDGVDKELRCVFDENGEKIYSVINQDEECWLFTGTDDFNSVAFSIFPNPTLSKIKIDMSALVNKVELYASDGQMVKSIVGNNTIDVTPFQSGIYYLKIYTNEGIGVESFIKL